MYIIRYYCHYYYRYYRLFFSLFLALSPSLFLSLSLSLSLSFFLSFFLSISLLYSPSVTLYLRHSISLTSPHNFSTFPSFLFYIYASCQVFASALNLFQELELWDEVVTCYQLLQVNLMMKGRKA